jgi:hypothetical protein
VSVDFTFHYVRQSYCPHHHRRWTVDPWIQIFGLFGQLMFYGGLLVLLVGFPVFLWLFVRLCRDVHAIRAQVVSDGQFEITEVNNTDSSVTLSPSYRAGVANSVFGR